MLAAWPIKRSVHDSVGLFLEQICLTYTVVKYDKFSTLKPIFLIVGPA